MGRVWIDDDEQERPPLSNWRVLTVIALLIIFILVFTSCSEGLESIGLPEAAAAPAPQSLDMEAGPEFELCDEVIAGETSHLVPDDWGDWCQGANDAAQQFIAGTDADNASVCDYFWEADDDDLVAYAIEEGGTFSWSVGFVDFMWWYC